MRKLSLYVCWLLVCLTPCFGQIIPLYPDVQSTYNFNLPSITAAHIPEEGEVVVGGVYKFISGEPNLALFDINAGYILRKGKGSASIFRINLSNEKEGPYIKTPRGNFNYAYQIQLSEKVKLSSGLAFGFVSRQYSAPSSTGKGNVLLPDGHFALELGYEKNLLGITVSQFLNSKGAAIESTSVLKTYYQFYGAFQQKLGFYWSLHENLLFRYMPATVNQWVGGVSLMYKHLVGGGVVYYQRRGMAFILTAKIDHEQYPIIFNMGYNSSVLSQSPIWVNSFELGMRLCFR